MSSAPTVGRWLCALVLASAAALPGSAMALSWSGPVPAAAQPPFARRESLSAVSCPSSSLCVAIDQGNIVTSTEPTGGAGAWIRTNLVANADVGLSAVSCPSQQLCVAVGYGGVVATATDPKPGSAWQHFTIPHTRYLAGVSCTATHVCAALDTNGNVFSSTDPQAGAAAWHRAHIGRAYALACRSARLCVALGAGPHVFTSENPAAGRRSWRMTRLPGHHGFDSVSCPSSRLCVAIGNGVIATSRHPARGGRAWSVRGAPAGGPGVISCPSTQVCVVASDGELLVLKHPAGRPRHWTTAQGAGTDVSCPSVQLCVAVRSEYATTSTDLADPHPSWTKSAIDGVNPLAAVSCPSRQMCVAIGGYNSTGVAISTADPGGAAQAWSQSYGDPAASVSCPSAGLCVAGDQNGTLLTSTDPGAPLDSWSRATILSPYLFNEGHGHYDIEQATFTGVSCPTASACVATATDGVRGGDVLISTDPTGGASAWQSFNSSEHSAVSCPSQDFCATAGGTEISVSSDPFGGGVAAWRTETVDPTKCAGCAVAITGIACPSASVCVAVDNQGNVTSSSDPAGDASSWAVATVDATNSLTAVACPSTGLCVAVDDHGNVLTASDPAGGPGAWSVIHADSSIDLFGIQAELTGISCASAAFCVAVDNVGNVVVGSD